MSWNNIVFDDVVIGVVVLGVVGDFFGVMLGIVEGIVEGVVVVVDDGVLVFELAVYAIDVVKFDEVRMSSDSLVSKFEDVKFVDVVILVVAMADEA